MTDEELEGSLWSGIGAAEMIQNVVIGLAVSFVALSLGAALGVLSGRGAFAGMISAGIIAFVTSVFGGTRVQCSGPTAPMSAVSAVVVAYAYNHIVFSGLSISAEHFVNVVFFLTGVILLLMAFFRMGRFISIVPKVVISGFMSGIALQIWIDQLAVLMGWGGKAPLGGPVWMNLTVAAGTLVLIFLLAPLMKYLVGRAARFLPATLMAILLMTGICVLMALPIESIRLSESISSVSDFFSLMKKQVPDAVSFPVILLALPYAIQLALLGYLDTLLTSLVVDKMSCENTRQDKELMAQGFANSAVAFFGGIPGAQATIRSVLMLKENATLRLAGIMVGVFVIVEVVLFQGFINHIPKAVFVGVLLKVGYDVFDFMPLRLYCKELFSDRPGLLSDFFSRHDDEPLFVTNRELVMIMGTAIVTVVMNLNVAVGVFTILFYLHNRFLWRDNPMRDLAPVVETSGYDKED